MITTLDVITLVPIINKKLFEVLNLDKKMALALPEILNKILNFLAKDNTLYPTFLVSKLGSCAPVQFYEMFMTFVA